MKSKNIKLKFGGDLTSNNCIDSAASVDINGKLLSSFDDFLKNPLADGGNIYFPPPSSIDQETILKEVKKYFEIFYTNIEIDNNITVNNNTEPYFLILFMERYTPNTDKFNNDLKDPKYNNFKRFMLSESLDGPLPLGFVFPNSNLSVIFYDSTSSAHWACVIAHEIGHLFELPHRGDITNTYIDDGVQKVCKENNNYYNKSETARHNIWGPIMGLQPPEIEIFQWSNGDYINAYPSFRSSPRGRPSSSESIGDDITYITYKANLLKTVPNQQKENFNNQKPWADFEDPFPKIDKKTARLITKNYDSALGYEGLIGYPYDYDILKILLPAGDYSFEINSILFDDENLAFSMLYPKLDLLYCNVELDKQKENITMDEQFGNLSYVGAKYDTLDTAKIGIKNETKYIKEASTPQNSLYRSSTSNITLDYTTMVYLRACGNYRDPVDGNESPSRAYLGWSRYGSIGRYEVRIDGGSVLLESYSNTGWEIPNGHAEKFDICDKKIFLFMQDEKDPEISANPFELHILEHKFIVNGNVEEEKFLVYGKPIDIKAPEDPKKFYLSIIDKEDNQGKKQEFIVGQGLEEEDESI